MTHNKIHFNLADVDFSKGDWYPLGNDEISLPACNTKTRKPETYIIKENIGDYHEL